MPTNGRSTLTQFLIESRRDHPQATGELNALVTAVALACKATSRKVAFGALSDFGEGSAAQDDPKGLVWGSQRMFLHASEWGGYLAGILSEPMSEPYAMPAEHQRGKYLLVLNPVDGPSNVDINVTVGSLFSILRAPNPMQDARAEDFLQRGADTVCAGYAIYGPATMLVLSFGNGTHGFTLDPQLGEWVLSHRNLKIPAQTREFSTNAAHSQSWEPAVKRYIEECLAGQSGPRNADFSLRWAASLVAQAHRVLMRGGVCLYPRDVREPGSPGRLRLLFEIDPIAFLIEQAGGLASTGHGRVLDVVPTSSHQRSAFVFGSAEEVSRIETYHREGQVETYRSPLFGERGLFAPED